MINFRFHLVSLVAVFLALAIGVVMGYGVLGQPTVETLQDRIDTVEANANARRRENGELRDEVDRLDTAHELLAPFAVTDRLLDTSTVVMAVRGVDPSVAQEVVQLIRQAGGRAPGVLWVEDRWRLSAPEERDALARILDSALTRRAPLRDRGWRELVERLGRGPALGSDLLGSLTDAGFVTFEALDSEATIDELGGAGARLVLLVGSAGEVSARQSLLPAALAATESGIPLVGAEVYAAGDAGPGRGAAVGVVRDDERLAAAVSTVDDADRPSGPTVVVLAVADLVRRGTPGHYGFGEGAVAAVPEWWQPVEPAPAGAE